MFFNYKVKLLVINRCKRLYIESFRHRIIKAFPSSLANDVGSVLRLLPLKAVEMRDYKGRITAIKSIESNFPFEVVLNGEKLRIPYRIYFDEPDIEKESQLTLTQKAILNCIYTRHHNGFVRQRRLELLLSNSEYWVTPYMLRLLGEYVYEIHQVLEHHIVEKNLDNYKQLVLENPFYWKQTRNRIASYWYEYFRRKKGEKLVDNLGYQLAERIENRLND